MFTLVASNPDTLPSQDWRMRLLEWLRRWRRYGYLPARGWAVGALFAMSACSSAGAWALERTASHHIVADTVEVSNQQAEGVALGFIASHAAVLSH